MKINNSLDLEYRLRDLRYEFMEKAIFGIEIKRQTQQQDLTIAIYLQLDHGMWERRKFLDIIRNHDFDIGHIIFPYNDKYLLIELVDMKETNDLR